MSLITCSRKPLKLTWNIQKYSARVETLGEGIESPLFEIESLGPISWCLVFYPRGYKNTNYVACFLKRCDSYCTREAVVDLEICLKAENGAEHFLKTAFNLEFKDGNSFGFPKFVTCGELQRCPFPNDILTLQFYISPSNDKKYVEDYITLSNDIKLLHDKTTFYDVIIRAGKNEFKVHKPLLIARFPSLVNKIEYSQYDESIPFVDISDFSPGIVREVLYFVYTGKLTKSHYFRAKLKEFASKYDMNNLISKLKWNVDECIMNNYITITTTKHILPLPRLLLGHEVNIVFPGSLHVDSNTKLNVQYLTDACLQGININIGLFLETSYDCKYSHLAKFTCSIMCDQNKILESYEHSIHINNFDSENCVKLGIVPSYQFSFLIEDTFMENGIPTNLQNAFMFCDWNVSCSSSSIRTIPMLSDTLTSFSADMYELFQSGVGTDLVLVTVLDGIEFNVHKCVVCARVPSIMAMFKDDTLAVNGYVHDDLKNVKVEIPDVDSNTFRSVLEYIYSGKIDESAMKQLLKLHPKLVPIYMKQLQKKNRGEGNLATFRKQRNTKLNTVLVDSDSSDSADNA